MNLSLYVRFWGGLDVAYILWRVVKDISESNIPFLCAFSEAIGAAEEFGQTSILIMTVVAAVVTLSIVLSGPLMLALRKVGVYISLLQLPFRLTLLLPPTFFFIQSARDYLPSMLLIAMIFILEIVKAITEILWLRSRKQPSIETTQEDTIKPR